MLRFLLTSLTFLAVFTAQFAFGKEETKRVKWEPLSYAGAVIFYDIMRVMSLDASTPVPEPIQLASCYLDVLRPAMGGEVTALKDSRNHARCTTWDGKLVDELTLDLSEVEISAWGNKFFPKGFSVTGEVADKLYTAFERVYKARAENPHLAPFMAYRDDEFPAHGYAATSYNLGTTPVSPSGEITGLGTLTCLKEYYYVTDVRPESPRRVRCDFVYQFSADK